MTQTARMIGKAGGRRFTCDCCDWSKGKRGVKADEDKQWSKDAEDEMAHPIGTICDDPYTCSECGYEDLDASYDNSDLDGIEGVWCNVDWRN